MTYGEIRREVLSHIRRYSIAGSEVPASYNHQADDLNRIPGLINEALVNIRTLVKRETVVWELAEGEPYGGLTRCRLPEDFFALRTGGVWVLRDGRLRRTNDYRLQGREYILIPGGERYTVEYDRYPRQLPLDAADDFVLEEDLEVIQTATYYAAANLVLQEDEFAYAALYNDYETRLGRISAGITAEVGRVEDVYGFGG